LAIRTGKFPISKEKNGKKRRRWNEEPSRKWHECRKSIIMINVRKKIGGFAK